MICVLKMNICVAKHYQGIGHGLVTNQWESVPSELEVQRALAGLGGL